MKILLIDPYFREGLKGFPLGLAYIAGALRENGQDVSALDLTAKVMLEGRNCYDILDEELRTKNPDLVGITSTSPTHRNALQVAKLVKQFKDIPIIKGGPHETNCAETTLKNDREIDYSVVGEGEETIVELVERISRGENVLGLDGIVFRDGSKIVNNGRRKLIQNLDSLPQPARDLFYLDERFNHYYSASLFNGKKSTSVMTSRGCPYSCSFCSSKVNWGKVRQRSVDNVVKELEELYSQGFRGFSFEDDMSLVNKKWFLDFTNQLKQRGLNIEYSLQTRVDAIDKDVAKSLAESGCKLMYFGIESGVQDILDGCRKGITLEKAKNAFDMAKKYGVRNMATIQFGLPGEDLENLSTVRETIRIMNEVLKPDEVAISYTSLYPGSPLAIKSGITPEMYEYYVKTKTDEEIYRKTAHGSLSIHPRGLTSEKISEIERVLDSELKIKRFDVKTFYKT